MGAFHIRYGVFPGVLRAIPSDGDHPAHCINNTLICTTEQPGRTLFHGLCIEKHFNAFDVDVALVSAHCHFPMGTTVGISHSFTANECQNLL